MLERDLQAQIIKYLRRQPSTFVIKTIQTNNRGIPDLIICRHGQFIFIEIKKPDTPANGTPLQRHQMDALRDAGAVGFVTNNFNDFLTKYQQIILQPPSLEID